MTLKSIQRIFKFLSLILIVAACAKDEGLVIRKKSFTISEDQLAPVYKANNVPADLQDSYIVVFKDDVAESEIDAFVLRDGWEDAIEKAKKHFEKIEDYEMCHTCVSLIEEIKKSN